MTGFTPGPWRTMDGDSVVNVMGAEGAPIAATTSKTYYERFDATDKANARLISAAPDLYAALDKLLTSYVDIGESGDCGFWEVDAIPEVIAARAALKRARGEA